MRPLTENSSVAEPCVFRQSRPVVPSAAVDQRGIGLNERTPSLAEQRCHKLLGGTELVSSYPQLVVKSHECDFEASRP
jgi:hypothetical protein